MVSSEGYFFDSYAFIELMKKNRNYEAFNNVPFCTTQVNIFEVHYYLTKTIGDGPADFFAETMRPSVAPIDFETIKEASHFRFEHKKKKFSMVDCIGYMTAKRLGVKFLTGDREFEGMDNVEFVK
ncbi:MAG TPA: PIN domain-containing protein [Candidatus Nanoarchaeia archaeon]|nr:PIN domain-containing protein [Candidatus Nanoarchaeia archaeon]